MTHRLFFDGAMGTMLQNAGLPEGYPPDLWSVEKPETVQAIHKAYLEAGCRISKTNTFGANALKLSPYGKTVEEVVKAAVACARVAGAEYKEEQVIALDIGPTGKLLSPLGDLEFEEAVSLFGETVRAGVKAGVDCILIETMSDTYELKAAVLAAKENSSLPIIASVIFDEKGKLLTGADIASTVALLEGLGVTAIGLNCGMGPSGMKELVKELRKISSLPLAIAPNAGLPRSEAGKTHYDVSPEEFAESMEEIVSEAALVGGCCGTTPDHMKALIGRFGNSPIPETPCYDELLVSSYSQCVRIGKKRVIIGERINPTGKKKLKEALKSGDTEYILREALSQEEKGAHILDINVGMPGIDEKEKICEIVKEVQKITALPLQLDTSDPVAMEKAMRLYNGKPLVNSVNGKEESMEAILPLVKKYGGGIVALTLDENGIPETVEGRFKIAKRIVERCEKYGIPRREILVDTLTLPISANADAAKITLDALEKITNELGVKTVLGVSNVSFGLPQREKINTAFFTMALQKGLSAGIVNPLSDLMMSAFDSFLALEKLDPQCADFIARHSAEPAPVQAEQKTGGATLFDAVLRGLAEPAFHLAKEEVKSGKTPLEVIDTALVPALDRIGIGFEAGKVFLPQLLMSAEAAKAAFDALKEFLTVSDETKSKQKIVLATVQGDIHDIGKNIVKVLLENYRFCVIDLGKDVSPEKVVEAVLRENATLCGLSALMTTTVPAMQKTIELVHQNCPGVKVMVGGAVLTEEFALSIGADGYCKDAMASVNYAKKHFNEN